MKKSHPPFTKELLVESDNDHVRIRGRSTGAKPILPNTIGAKADYRWHLNAYWRPQDYCNNVCLRDCGTRSRYSALLLFRTLRGGIVCSMRFGCARPRLFRLPEEIS